MGLYRSFYDRVNVAALNTLGLPVANYNANTGGGGVGGSITWTAIPKTLDLQATAMTGTGIGRYGSGQLPDVTIAPDGYAGAGAGNHLPGRRHLAHHAAAGHLCSMAARKREAQDLCRRRRDHRPGQPHAEFERLPGRRRRLLAQHANREPDHRRLLVAAYQGKFGSFRLGAQYSYTHLTRLRRRRRRASRPRTTA